MASEWKSTEHALAYLQRADQIPHRTTGESVLLEELPQRIESVLDLGCGDGRLLHLVLLDHPEAIGVGLDFSPVLLHQAENRFENSPGVKFEEHDLDLPLPDMGVFDAVVSSFAIHHLEHARKRTLYEEIWKLLNPGGAFCNLEHVASPSIGAHNRFLEAMGITAEEEDPSNKLLDVETQLGWLRDSGFEEVDCYWRWRELALLVGRKPGFDTNAALGDPIH